ncbi:MAG: low molecular weight phosphotyrosine protein phosphatase [Clostridiales bacterium]|nr:low molecular weight phosphotyrosine protein phosphatase [Clostridiales bacterium]
MTKILFICHGNICRSPMAEFVFKDMLRKKGIEHKYEVASAATSTEELGNNVHHGTIGKLNSMGIAVEDRRAWQIRKSDYDKYDLFILMDENNMRNVKRIFSDDCEKKIQKLLDYSTNPRDIADPWYTGNFDVTYDDIAEGCEALVEFLEKHYV